MDIFFGEFVGMMILTTNRLYSSISDTILSIVLFGCSPIEIVKRIIGTAVRSMTSEHSIGAWSDKGCENQEGDFECFDFSIDGKINYASSIS